MGGSTTGRWMRSDGSAGRCTRTSRRSRCSIWRGRPLSPRRSGAREVRLPVRELPYRSLHPLIRDHLSSAEDPETAALMESLRPARRRGYLTKSELEAICRWKSPRTSGRVRLNHRHRVRKATGTALQATGESECMRALLVLQGVSVPTASAILTMLDP